MCVYVYARQWPGRREKGGPGKRVQPANEGKGRGVDPRWCSPREGASKASKAIFLMIQEGGGERARGGKRIEDERKRREAEEDRGDAGRGGFGKKYEGGRKETAVGCGGGGSNAWQGMNEEGGFMFVF